MESQPSFKFESLLINADETCNQWSYGVTVSTLDSESSDRGSNPRETLRVIFGRSANGVHVGVYVASLQRYVASL